MITRLRPPHQPERIKEIYARPHDHRLYGRGHGERVEETIRIGRKAKAVTVADLSCGNGVIANEICAPSTPLLGDLAAGYQFHGPIEETIRLLEPVDLFVCCETLEHLREPSDVLDLIRRKCNRLLASVPVDNADDANEEHYWSWSIEDVFWLLSRAGFRPKQFATVDSREYGEPYCYGIWLLE